MAVEQIMFFALGFLVATLIAIMTIPSIWKRAVRLTRKRIEATMPLTMTEFLADKDQLRAEFALATRKLEMTIDSLRTRLTAQLGELNEKSNELALLRAESDRHHAVYEEFAARDAEAKERIQQLQREIADLAQKLRMRERDLEDIKNAATTAASPTIRKISDELRQRLDLPPSAVPGTETAEPVAEVPALPEAEGHLATLLRETGLSDVGPRPVQSLAEKLSQEDELERVRDEVTKIDRDIKKNWKSGKLDKDDLRGRLGDIASSVSRLVYAVDGESTAADAEESLFDRVKKFAGQDLETANETEDSDKRGKRRSVVTGPLSERLAAFEDMHVNN